MQSDAEMRKSVLDRAIAIIDFDVDTRGFSYSAPAGVLQRFPALLCSCGKFPKPAEQAILRALGNEYFVIVPHNARAQRVMGTRFLFRFDGQALWIAGFVSRTAFFYGTLIACGVFSGAYHRAEFHNRLIVSAGFTFGQQGLGEIPQLVFDAGLCDVVADVKEPRDNANDIAIEHGIVAIISNAQNCGCGIRPKARQGFEFVVRIGHCATKVCGNRMRGFVQIASASVIAQSFPGFEDIIL